jgi:hypothetical protein
VKSIPNVAGVADLELDCTEQRVCSPADVLGSCSSL